MYFETPVEITSDLIYKITELSKKGDPIPTKLNPGLVEELTVTPTEEKNSRELIVSQIIYDTPN